MTIKPIEAPSAIPARTETRKKPVSPDVAAEEGAVRQAADDSGHDPSRTITLDIPEITDGKLQLSIDVDTGRVIGKIVDKRSGEIIRQMPSDEILHLIAATEEELGPIYSTTA